jgi:hypothetical protein
MPLLSIAIISDLLASREVKKMTATKMNIGNNKASI